MIDPGRNEGVTTFYHQHFFGTSQSEVCLEVMIKNAYATLHLEVLSGCEIYKLFMNFHLSQASQVSLKRQGRSMGQQ